MATQAQKAQTTLFLLQRIARRLGIRPEQEAHILAGEIETAVRIFQTVKMLCRGGGEMRCTLCHDDGGPFLVRDSRLICEECDSILGHTFAQEKSTTRDKGEPQ